MFLNRSRSLAALAAGVLLLAPLAGCGSDKAKGSSAKPGPSSATSPSSAPRGTSVDINSLISQVTSAMKAKATAHMVMEIGSSSSAEADASGSAIRLTMTTGNQKINVIVTGGAMYLQQTAGGKYVKIGKDDPSLGGLLTQLSNIGPSALLISMKPGMKQILDVGTQSIDGTQTTHYAVTVDTAKASLALGAGADLATAGQPKTVTLDMYIDSEHLLRQLDLLASGQKIHMVVTDWGKPVTISAPPASQVTKK